MSADAANGEESPDTIKRMVGELIEAPGATPEFLREYMWQLLDQYKAFAKSFKRYIAGTLAAILAFELLNRGLVGEASMAGVKLARLEFLRIVLPVVVSFCTYRAFSVNLERLVCGETFSELMGGQVPKAVERHFDLLLLPDTPLATSTVSLRYVKGKGTKFVDELRTIEVLLYLVVPPLFTIYAFVQLFGSYGITDFFVWASLALVLIFYALCVAMLRLDAK